MSTVMATGWMQQKLAEHDPAVAQTIRDEVKRQHEHLELIASENFVSEAVLEATGSVFTNKYAEGYPGKRYYGGCEYADAVETLAIERAKQLFGAEHVNVQPHAGSQANMAAYTAVLNPGDTIFGMNLAHGGHLTHGSPVNFSGKVYNVIPYGVSKETETIDYDALEALAVEKKPKLIVAGGSAYARTIDFPRMRAICDQVGALLMVDMAHFSGLVAAGVHPSPVPHADIVTSTTHKTLRGPRSGMIMCKAQYAQAVDKTVFPGMQGGPLVHVMAAKAVCFLEALTPEFKEYGRQVVANARVLAETLMKEGFHVVSNGTDTHLMVVDVFSSKDGKGGLRGKEAETALHRANITISRSTIPFDTNTPFNPSGIRVGSQAVTTRGMKETEMRKIGACIAEALRNTQSDAALAGVRKSVLELAAQFPLYGWRRM